MKELHNYSLKRHNTFGIDVSCRRYLEYATPDEARQVAATLRADATPFIIIGGGSNLLLTGDFAGTVVRSAIVKAGVKGDRVRCGSGVRWDDLVEYAISHGLYGLENLSDIPGDVGAAAVQNIGAYGVEAKEYIDQVHAIEIATGEERVISRDACDYGYRHSRFKAEWAGRYLITGVDFRLRTDFVPRLDYGNIRHELERQGISQPSALDVRRAVTRIRREKLPDPRMTGNAGSFFMNPVVSRGKYEQLAAENPGMPHYPADDGHEKIPAGWLIEQCGWKGRTMGRAGVHPRQALVLVNLGDATGADIVALSRAIQHDVSQRFGIDIHPEVNIV